MDDLVSLSEPQSLELCVLVSLPEPWLTKTLKKLMDSLELLRSTYLGR